MFLFKDGAYFSYSALDQILMRFVWVNPHVSLELTAGSGYVRGCILRMEMFGQRRQTLVFSFEKPARVISSNGVSCGLQACSWSPRCSFM